MKANAASSAGKRRVMIMSGIRVSTGKGAIGIGVMDVPGRKQKALYRARGANIDVLAYFRSEGCADDFQKAIDWIADEMNATNNTQDAMAAFSPVTGSASLGAKCIVYGCSNRQGQGVFVGDICGPCRRHLIKGEVGPTTSFLGEMFGIWVDAATQKPKTGKKVIVCGRWSNGNRWRTIATWQPAGSIDASRWDDTPDDWWDEDGNVCTNPTDEWSESPVEGERSYGLENVTHWMPLPDMPNAKGEPR